MLIYYGKDKNIYLINFELPSCMMEHLIIYEMFFPSINFVTLLISTQQTKKHQFSYIVIKHHLSLNGKLIDAKIDLMKIPFY